MADGLLAGVCSVATALALGHPGFDARCPLQDRPRLVDRGTRQPFKMFRENLTPALAIDASSFGAGASRRRPLRLRLGSPFCTTVHSFPQPNFPIPLAKKSARVYSLAQIEPGSLKNLTAQLKEGAAAARQLRPQSFWPHFWRTGGAPLKSRGEEQLLPRKRRNRFPRSEERLLPSARGDSLDRRNLAVPHQQSAIKVVHRRTNVARKQVEEVSDAGT